MKKDSLIRKFTGWIQAQTEYERWIIRYRIWIEDEPWCWEYRLIHGGEE